MSTPGPPTPINDLSTFPLGTPITGTLYAFDGAGGFEMEQGFSTITTLPEISFNNYDLTNAVQVTLSVDYINSLLGLVKSTSTTSYSESLQTFTVAGDSTTSLESITITSSDFKAQLASDAQIISVGAYAGMYTNFENYVKKYFGYPGGFASLFNQASLFDLSSNDYVNLYKLLVPISPDTTTIHDIDASGDEISGNFIKDLSGSITISNITQTLRYAVDTNVFGNRASGTSMDPNGNIINYGVGDGFLAGDLIYVKLGTKITLDLDIEAELFSSPFNNPNENNTSTFTGLDSVGLNTLTTSQDSAITNLVVSGDYSSASTVTRKNINRILKAPLLIRLANPSDIAALTVHT